MNCRALLVSHQVCPVCGNYRGNAVVEAGEQASKYR